jgi:hypothetical protein
MCNEPNLKLNNRKEYHKMYPIYKYWSKSKKIIMYQKPKKKRSNNYINGKTGEL